MNVFGGFRDDEQVKKISAGDVKIKQGGLYVKL